MTVQDNAHENRMKHNEQNLSKSRENLEENFLVWNCILNNAGMQTPKPASVVGNNAQS